LRERIRLTDLVLGNTPEERRKTQRIIKNHKEQFSNQELGTIRNLVRLRKLSVKFLGDKADLGEHRSEFISPLSAAGLSPLDKFAPFGQSAFADQLRTAEAKDLSFSEFLRFQRMAQPIYRSNVNISPESMKQLAIIANQQKASLFGKPTIDPAAIRNLAPSIMADPNTRNNEPGFVQNKKDTVIK